MPAKKGYELTDRHLAILRAIRKLQPCGSIVVVRETGQSIYFVRDAIYYTLSRRGLVDSEIIRRPNCKPRRKPGTLRLTAEGERLAHSTEVTR